jgi:CO/xanthine dehydrogenase FAD-binding subunit
VTPAAFHYARPDSVAAAVALLNPRSQLLAGGQSLVPLLVRRAARPELVVDINRIPGLADIDIEPGAIRMGALVRLEQARCADIVRTELAVLAAALGWVANPVIRRRGTVVGNLVMNAPGAELPAVAVALGAQFLICGRDGNTATIPAHQPLPPASMVTHVVWPRQTGCGGFYEVSRRDGHVGIVGAAVSRNSTDTHDYSSADTHDESRDDIRDAARCDIRVGVSGLCATGLACKAVAQVLADAHPAAPELPALAEALRADIGDRPLYGDLQAPAKYRLRVTPEVIRRAAQSMPAGRG